MINEKIILQKLESDTRRRDDMWHINDLSEPPCDSEKRMIGNAYVANLGEDFFRIYKIEFKDYIDVDEYQWVTGTYLEIVDCRGVQKWEFSSNRKINDIYELAKYQAEKIDDIFNSYLNSHI